MFFRCVLAGPKTIGTCSNEPGDGETLPELADPGGLRGEAFE